MKPTRYFVRYRNDVEDTGDGIDPSDLFDQRDFAALPAARRFAKSNHSYAEIVERVGLEDVTPDGDPRGLLWEYQEKQVEDYH